MPPPPNQSSRHSREEDALWIKVLLYLVIIIFLAAGGGICSAAYPWFSHQYDVPGGQADRILNDTTPMMWNRFYWGLGSGALLGAIWGAGAFRKPSDDDFKVPRDDTR